MSNDTIGKTLTVAFFVCLVCSIIVAGSAVSLRSQQQANKVADMQRNILAAAGLLDAGKPVGEQFAQVEARLVNLETGAFVTDAELTEFGITVDGYDQRKAAKDPAFAVSLTAQQDVAGLKRAPRFAKVYLVNDADGNLDTMILPVSGYGLWSTLYGFLALEEDLNTVVGLGFYDHAETPGLGGEVDNPSWKAMWPGKRVFDEAGNVAAMLKKGVVNPAISAEANHQVDGLSGATLTSRGVTNLLHFWLGSDGFGPFLKSLNDTGA